VGFAEEVRNFDEPASSGAAGAGGGGSSIASVEEAMGGSTMLTAFLSTAEGNPLRLAKQIQSSLKLAS